MTFKVGDRVKVKNIDSSWRDEKGCIIKMPRTTFEPCLIKFDNPFFRDTEWVRVDDLEKIEDEEIKVEDSVFLMIWGGKEWVKLKENEMKPEIKLEIGKKYEREYDCDSPYIYIFDKRNLNIILKDVWGDTPLIFIDKDGCASSKPRSWALKLKEHKEPIKTSGEYWILYDPVKSLLNNADPVDLLTGLDTTGALYADKDIAVSDSSGYFKIKKFRITAEEI